MSTRGTTKYNPINLHKKNFTLYIENFYNDVMNEIFKILKIF